MFAKSTTLKTIKTTIKCALYSTKPSYIHKLGDQPLKYITIGQLLQETASKFGDRKAVISVHQNEFLTFSELLQKADKLAATLKNLNLEKGDRLGLWVPNLVEWYVTKMASARAGLITVCLNPVLEAPEIEYCVNKTGIKALVCADEFKHHDYYESLLSIAPELENCDPGKLKSTKVPSLKTVIRIGEENKRGTYNFGEILDRANSSEVANIAKLQHMISPDDGCSLYFTSGTTGKPKVALTTHFKLVNSAFFTGKRLQLSSKHHKLCAQVPLFHIYGTVVGIMAALNHASTIVLPTNGYQPSKTLDAIKNEKCTVIYGTPTMYTDLIQIQEKRTDPIAAEIAVIGGAPVTPYLIQQISETLNVTKVHPMYGITECSGAVFESVPTESETNHAPVEYVEDHFEVKVINESGGVVPFGTAGELCVKSYSTMVGYWEDEEKTNEILGRDGWLKTGSVSFLNCIVIKVCFIRDQFILEEDGSGRVVGRLKDVIIRGGQNIFPKEIEEFLVTHPNILDVQVIGTPHTRLGEEVCACITIKPQSHLTLEDIATFCKGKLAYFKIPSRMEIFDNFPKTVSGKIQKFKLKEILSEKNL
ncbi:medium-chain acyl-CoA ligase ACSF2, mitochondrial-like isoform X1 [Zophobas morio]|uniref:medium-chain acyl-CoA ligase ACSF2, mitochondrial-like isoform X1 n=1 Tax=Zophobas morio TaxID=2755281 RepID=UPI003082EC26